MRIWKICGLLAVVVLGPVPAFAADAPKKGADGALIVIDSAGKEQKLKAWKFLTGTRHLSWFAPAAPEEKAAAARLAMMTSRFNTMFSIPMLFCMVAQQNAGL